MTLLVVIAIAWFFTYIDARVAGAIGRLKWREIKGVTRFLLKGPEANAIHCRSCEIEIPYPSLERELGYGVIVCEPCREVIELEVGLRHPDWFDKPLPAEAEAKKIPPPTIYDCAYCREEHDEGFICLKDMAQYVVNSPEQILRYDSRIFRWY